MTLGSRSRRSRRSRGAWRLPALLAMGAVVVAAAVFSSAIQPARLVEASSGGPGTPPVTAALKKLIRPTPCFAEYCGLRLRLPVPVDAVTAIAFHQASFKLALPMSLLVPTMDLSMARQAGKARKSALASGTVIPAVRSNGDTWGGSAVRLWRAGRSGAPSTAADVGALPGTTVLSPVDGTVVLVREYKLYNKFQDFEVHIIPTGRSDVDVILLHVTDVRVAAGDRVEAGVSPVASVRRLSKLATLQLRTYSGDGGDHTHLQINRTPSPGTIWVSAPKGPVAMPYSLSATGSVGATPAP